MLKLLLKELLLKWFSSSTWDETMWQKGNANEMYVHMMYMYLYKLQSNLWFIWVTRFDLIGIVASSILKKNTTNKTTFNVCQGFCFLLYSHVFIKWCEWVCVYFNDVPCNKYLLINTDQGKSWEIIFTKPLCWTFFIALSTHTQCESKYFVFYL